MPISCGAHTDPGIWGPVDLALILAFTSVNLCAIRHLSSNILNREPLELYYFFKDGDTRSNYRVVALFPELNAVWIKRRPW